MGVMRRDIIIYTYTAWIVCRRERISFNSLYMPYDLLQLCFQKRGMLKN